MYMSLFFRLKDDTLETDEFKNFFLRSLGKSASSSHCCMFIRASAGSTFGEGVGIFRNPWIQFRILGRINKKGGPVFRLLLQLKAI